jgi:hypothetical protein
MTKLEYILDLRRRVEALEARAAAEESSATDVDSALLRTGMVTARHLATIKESLRVEPAPAPAADRPLWEVMSHACYPIPPSGDKHDWADAIDAVATWLERRYLDRYPGAAELLRNEARRAREGA